MRLLIVITCLLATLELQPQQKLQFKPRSQRFPRLSSTAPRAQSPSLQRAHTGNAGWAQPWVSERPSLPTGAAPAGVTTGDFNGDGFADFAVCNALDETVWIYLGDGHGGFQTPHIFQLAGNTPVAIAVGDLQHRGILDLVVTESDSQTVEVLSGNGDGTFQLGVTYPVSNQAFETIAVADVNNDGFPDVLTAQDGWVLTFLNDGKGNLSSPIANQGPAYIFPNGDFLPPAGAKLVVTDLNRDGKPDLVLTSQQRGLATLLGTGDGHFNVGPTLWAPNLVVEIWPIATAAFDADGDGCIDLELVNSLGQLFRYAGKCDGTFTQLDPLVSAIGHLGDTPAQAGWADVDGDGKPDLIFSSQTSPYIAPEDSLGRTIGVRKNLGGHTFAASRLFDAANDLWDYTTADFNGDGKPDIVAISESTDRVFVLLNDGTGSFGDPQGVSISPDDYSSNTVLSFTFADIDVDGIPDIIATNTTGQPLTTTNKLAVVRGLPNHRWADPVFSDIGLVNFYAPFFFTVGDFRHTGHMDWVGSANAQLLFMPNLDGTHFGAPVPITGATGHTLSQYAVGDFNRDGNLDFVEVGDQCGGTTCSIDVFLGKGDGTFTQGYHAMLPALGATDSPAKVIVTDVNGDGKLDLLVHMLTSDRQNQALVEALGNGDGTFQPGTIVIKALRSFDYRDINGDGIRDIVALDGQQYTVPPTLGSVLYTYLGKPDGTFTAQAPVTLPYAGVEEDIAYYSVGDFLLAGDFNLDGKQDIGVLQMAPDRSQYIQFVSGNGDGTFTPTLPKMFATPGRFFGGISQTLGQDTLTETALLTGGFTFRPPAPGPVVQVAFATERIMQNSINGAVQLNVPSANGTSVTLSSSDPNILLPSSVAIPAGSAAASFSLQLLPGFDASRPLTVTATSPQGSGSATIWSLALGQPVSPVIGSIDFGSVRNGQTGAQNLVLTNNTLAPISISNLSVPNTSMFGITSPCTTIPAGGTCTLGLSFSPGNSFTSLFTTSATLTFNDSASQHTHIISLSGTGIVAQLNLYPNQTLSFSNQVLGTTAQISVLVINTGTAPADISSTSISGADYSVQPQCSVIQGGSGCMFVVQYTPHQAGNSSATVTINSDAINSPLAFTVTGNAVDGPIAQLSSNTLNFTPALTNTPTPPVSVQLSNVGNQPLTLGTPTGFGSLQVSGCSTPLAPGNSCTISVALTPLASGQQTGYVTFPFNGGSFTLTLNYTGALLQLSQPSTAPLQVKSGSSVTTTLSLAELYATGAPVAFSCASSTLPIYASCSFTPASLVAGSNAQNVQLTISTSKTILGKIFLWRTTTVAVAGVFLLSTRRRKLARVALCATLLIACGGGGGNGGSIPPSGGGGGGGSVSNTPPGTYTITINAASGSYAVSNNVTLVVN